MRCQNDKVLKWRSDSIVEVILSHEIGRTELNVAEGRLNILVGRAYKCSYKC
jgi:hypothetical protein